jgi:hypothetical protein
MHALFTLFAMTRVRGEKLKCAFSKRFRFPGFLHNFGKIPAGFIRVMFVQTPGNGFNQATGKRNAI